MNTRPSRPIWISTLGAALALVSGWASAQQTYRLTDLGKLGGTKSYGVAINDSGQVTGWSETSINGRYHAFLWDGATMQDLGTLGGTKSEGRAINAFGQVTGSSYTTGDARQHAFLSDGGPMQDLGTLGGLESFGYAINDSGQVTGAAETTSPVGPLHAFLWDGIAMQDFGTLGGTHSGGTAINAAGQVTGYANTTSDAEAHAFLWDGSTMQDLGTLGGTVSGGTDINVAGLVTGYSYTTGNVAQHAFLSDGGPMQDLGTLGGTVSVSRAINDSGEVTGESDTTGDAAIHAFLWDGSAMRDLSTLGGSNSFGLAINASGQVTGKALAQSNAVYHSFLSDGGPMQGLNIDPADPLRGSVTLNEGRDINDRGQILANGCFSGGNECHAFIVTPIPVPIIGPTLLPDMNSDGATDIAVIRDEPIRAEIRSGQDGALLGTINYLDSSVIPLEAQALSDSDGDGVPELAVLAIRRSDGRGVVEIRNLTGTSVARQTWYGVGLVPVSMVVIESDADNNGVAEIAVLSSRSSDGRGLVEVKNVFGAVNSNSLLMGVGLTALDLEIVEDADGNGIPEVAVLSRRDSDARIMAQVKNAAGAPNTNTVYFMSGGTPIDLAVVSDADGNTVPELAVLSFRSSDRRNVVEIKNAAGALNPNKVWFAAGNRALAVNQVADADGNSVPEIAVLSVRESDSRVLVDIRNAGGAAKVSALLFPVGFTARNLAMFDDFDGNGVEEAAVLLVRDSDSRILVQSRNTAGAPGTKNYWYSP